MGLLFLLALATLIVWAALTAAIVHRLRHPRRKTLAVALAKGDPIDPDELGFRFSERNFRFWDKIQTPGWVIEGESSAGPAVVMLHGFGDSRYGALRWVPLVQAFASQVVVFDLPGQGESQASRSFFGTREWRDVLAIMDQLALPHGAVLFGYSMGAGIAIAAAATGDKRIRGVIADGPYREWDEPVRELFARRRYPTWPILWFVKWVLRWTLPGIASFNRLDHAQQVKVPLWVLHGTADELCPFDSARQIATVAPQGKLIAFEGGRHLNLVEHDQTRYREAIAAFFNQLSETSGGASASDDHAADVREK